MSHQSNLIAKNESNRNERRKKHCHHLPIEENSLKTDKWISSVCVCVCVFYMAFIRTILPEFPLKSDNNDAKSELKTHKHQNEHTTGNRKA